MYLIRGFIVNGGLVKQIRHIKVCTVVGYGNEHLFRCLFDVALDDFP